MNHTLLISTLLAALSLVACDRRPTVVNTPSAPVVVPGPAGPAGPAGPQGSPGSPGASGSSGNSSSMSVPPSSSPPASAPANQ